MGKWVLSFVWKTILAFSFILALCSSDSMAAADDINLDDLFSDTSTAEPSTTTAVSTTATQQASELDSELDIAVEDFDFDFGPDELISSAPTPEPTTPAPSAGFDLTLPLFGVVRLSPFVDEQAQKGGMRAQLNDQKKRVSFGALTINQATVELALDGTVGITGVATLFDKKAEFGAKEIVFASPFSKKEENKPRFVKKLTLGFTFIDKPTLNLWGNNSVTINTADIILEHNKPVVVQTLTNLLGQKLILGFAITKKHAGAFLHVPPRTPLQDIFPQVRETALEKALLKHAELTINNVYRSSGLPSQDRHRSVTVKGLLDVNNPEIVDASTKDEKESFNGLELNGSLSKKGTTISLRADKFPLHNFGIINNATLTLDTTKDLAVHMKGTWDAAIPTISPFTAQITSSLTKKGVTLSGSTTTPIIYAGTTINHVKVHYTSVQESDKTKKVSGEQKEVPEKISPHILLSGDIAYQGLTLKVDLTVGKNPINQRQFIAFKSRSTMKEFKPFAQTPGLESFKITNIHAHIAIEHQDGKQQRTLQLTGKTHMFGGSFDSIISFINGDNGQSGVFVKVPLPEEGKVTDVAPKLTMLDSLDLRQVTFQLSTIDFTEPATNKKIKKGLSLSAKVPLTGPLEEAGKLLGASGQLFELEGNVTPHAPQDSSFSVILSRGTPDITKSMTINEIRLAIARGGIETLADLTVRPDPTNKPAESYNFTGTLQVDAFRSVIKARMDGTIKDIFSSGADLKDTALELGLLNSNPTIPTSGGFTIELIWKDMTFYGYALVDWTQVPPVLAFDIGVLPKDAQAKVSSTDLLNVIAQTMNKKIPDSFPKIDFYNLSGRFSSTFKTVTVGAKQIPPGIKFKANMDIFKRMGQAEFFIGCDDLLNCGIRAFGTIDPINVMNILTIKGHDAQALHKKFPTVTSSEQNSDSAEQFEQRKQEIINALASDNNKPIIDVEFTLLRQKFLIDGILNLGVPLSNGRRFTLLESSTFASLTGNSVLINTQGQIGGDSFSYLNAKGEEIPVLFAQVTLYSDRGFETPNFSLDLVFGNYFKSFVKQQAEQAFNKAIQEVENEISKAQREIDKIDAIIIQADTEILKAQADVEHARKSLSAINEAINEVRIAFEVPRDDVNSIARKIKELHAWYETLSTAEKVGRSLDYGIRIAGLEIAHKTSLGVLNGSESIATHTLNASRVVAEQTLALATGFLNEIVRKASPAILKGSAQTAKGILEGAKQTSVGALKAGKFTTNAAIGGTFQCDIQRTEFHGKLEDIRNGVLPSVVLEGEILGEPFRFTIAIDVTKGMSGLTTVIEPIARQIAAIPVTKTKRALNELSALFKPADRQADKIAQELKTLHEPPQINDNLEKLDKSLKHNIEYAKGLARYAEQNVKAQSKE